ncbi:MAG TPA: TadE/TadG family type IV pilus assembly protein [Bryobacterales bacterium]|nr:TadE/TadG family type IV pilus assembly protein [Bryobacterales bacterium]
MSNTMPRRRLPRGQALVEFALVLPMLLILIVNVVNFGAFFFTWITVANGARAGADYMVMGGDTVNSPPFPGLAAIQTVVQNDTSSLRNPGNLVIRVCYRVPSTNASAYAWGATGPFDPNPSACPSTFASPPAENPNTVPEAPLYNVGWVDVAYTFVPPVPLGFSFPGLNLYATLPSNLVIHRQAIMRLE